MENVWDCEKILQIYNHSYLRNSYLRVNITVQICYFKIYGKKTTYEFNEQYPIMIIFIIIDTESSARI